MLMLLAGGMLASCKKDVKPEKAGKTLIGSWDELGDSDEAVDFTFNSGGTYQEYNSLGEDNYPAREYYTEVTDGETMLYTRRLQKTLYYINPADGTQHDFYSYQNIYSGGDEWDYVEVEEWSPWESYVLTFTGKDLVNFGGYDYQRL
jgi:hypothetical protein